MFVSIPIWSDYLLEKGDSLNWIVEAFLFQYGLIIYKEHREDGSDFAMFLFQYGLIIYYCNWFKW